MIDALVLAHQVPENWRAQAEIFSEIFFVFLAIGTVVGIVVVAYTLYHAYKYRERGAGADEEGFEAPTLGELPRGQEGGKSRKLFLSFGLSAIIVISLVVYSYGLLLYVEQGPSSDVEQEGSEAQEINVTGYQFGWEFEYENGHTEQNTLRVPQGEDQVIRLDVTSRDVWHAFGVTELRLKADAIPGQTDTTWFLADQEGTYQVECFELCGVGHSQMTGEIIVMPEDEYQEWYEENAAGGGDDEESEGANGDDESPADETDDEGAGDEPADEPEETESPDETESTDENGSTGGTETAEATPTPTPGGDA